MLEQYFVKPATIDRIRSSWIGKAIEGYVEWLAGEGYQSRTVWHRVPILMQFGEFARAHGAGTCEDLPAQVGPFAAEWLRVHGRNCRTRRSREKLAEEAANPVRQMLRTALPGYEERPSRRRPDPFTSSAPGFFAYLREERGLKEGSVRLYHYHLRGFAAYLERLGVADLSALSPPVLSGFAVERSQEISKTGVRDLTGILRVFVGYLFREGVIGRDLRGAVESPRMYRLSSLPRAVTWDQVRRILESVDRRTSIGKRDYAMLLLLVTYGLRAHEVAGLTLDDVDWERERIFVRERKAGHSTAYPLSPTVGEALIDYLRQGRPVTGDRHVFMRALPPRLPLTGSAISCRTSHCLRQAGLTVSRAGSHTLRHTCVQRLVDAGFPLKTIGDYVGHRRAESTQIYAKIDTVPLRQVALAGEDVL